MPTGRLLQILEEHPFFSNLPPGSPRPSLENVLCITTVDLETQEHILNYQIPIAVSRYNIGLLVIDSITANYRAESSSGDVPGLLARAWELKRLGHFLRTLAARENIAVVVANQVSDQFSDVKESAFTDGFSQQPSSYPDNYPHFSSQPSPSRLPDSALAEVAPTKAYEKKQLLHLDSEISSSPPPLLYIFGPDRTTEEKAAPLSVDIPDESKLLSFEYQQPFFTGWGGSHTFFSNVTASGRNTDRKVPALGLVWTNQIACRIVLKVESVFVNANTAELPVHKSPQLSTAQNDGILEQLGEIAPQKKELSKEAAVLSKTEEELDTGKESKNLEKSRGTVQPEHGAEYFLSSPLPSPKLKRKRTLQVVFSPWTSGDPKQRTGNAGNYGDDYWEPFSGEEEVDGEGKNDVYEFDPTIEMVEFEILLHGIKGLTPQ